MLALYGSTVHPRCIVVFWTIYFFLLGVHASLKKKKLNDIIHNSPGVLGALREIIFTWGHAEWVETKKLMAGNFD